MWYQGHTFDGDFHIHIQGTDKIVSALLFVRYQAN